MNNYFIVKKEQLGDKDLDGFLRSAIAGQFGSGPYMILGEQTVDTLTSYSPRHMRKIKTFYVQEGDGDGIKHVINFDVTECTTNSWVTGLDGR